MFIAQEALSNIRKHAQASAVSVQIDNDTDYRLEIADNGRGFDLDRLDKQNERHVGLSIMQERAARLNGRLSIESQPGAGTRIRLHSARIKPESAKDN